MGCKRQARACSHRTGEAPARLLADPDDGLEHLGRGPGQSSHKGLRRGRARHAWQKARALAPEPPVPTIDRARRDWEHIMASEDPREFRAFIRAHEDGPYVWKAQNRLEDLANAAWAEMVKEPGEAALKKFLEVHFDSKHREAAEKRLEKPGRRSVQQRIARETSREALLALWDDDPDAVGGQVSGSGLSGRSAPGEREAGKPVVEAGRVFPRPRYRAGDGGYSVRLFLDGLQNGRGGGRRASAA